MTLTENTYKITANDLTNQSSSSPHLTTSSYVTLGERYAVQMNSVIS